METTSCGLTHKEIFDRAGRIASQRYPQGCADADKLAAIIREVIEEAKSQFGIVTPSRREIYAAKTSAGGWNRAQLAAWGVPWPPPKGWLKGLLGRG